MQSAECPICVHPTLYVRLHTEQDGPWSLCHNRGALHATGLATPILLTKHTCGTGRTAQSRNPDRTSWIHLTSDSNRAAWHPCSPQKRAGAMFASFTMDMGRVTDPFKSVQPSTCLWAAVEASLHAFMALERCIVSGCPTRQAGLWPPAAGSCLTAISDLRYVNRSPGKTQARRGSCTPCFTEHHGAARPQEPQAQAGVAVSVAAAERIHCGQGMRG